MGSISGDAVQTGFSVWAGGPVWERYSGLVLFGLEFALFGFFNFNLHFLRRPFSDAGYYVQKTKKPSSLKRRTAEERVLRGSALFEKEKAGILMALLRHKNPG